jgi:hypothetical protein
VAAHKEPAFPSKVPASALLAVAPDPAASPAPPAGPAEVTIAALAAAAAEAEVSPAGPAGTAGDAAGSGATARMLVIAEARAPPPSPVEMAAAPTNAQLPPEAAAQAPSPTAAARTFQFCAFLSHDWAEDEMGRSNHARVALVAQRLRSAGQPVWFDEDEMRGDVNRQMADGIEASACVIVFITKRYLQKAAGEGPNGDDDNCKFEFDYALRRSGVARMLSVVMEPSLRDPREWTGVVGGKLGGRLYVDLSQDGPQFDRGLERLLAEMRTVVEKASRAASSPVPTGGGSSGVAASSGAHPQPTVVEWPAKVVMEGQPFGLQGWNGPFVRTSEEVNGRPAYRRADVRLAGGLLPILPVELWWLPAEKRWALHRDVDKLSKHVMVSLHANDTPVGRWEKGVSVRLP